MGIAGDVVQVQRMNRNIFWVATMKMDLGAVAAVTTNGTHVVSTDRATLSAIDRLRAVAMAFPLELTGEADGVGLYEAAVAYRDAVIDFANVPGEATFNGVVQRFKEMRVPRAELPVSY